MDRLLKQPNETDLAYHKRLIFGKLVDGTLADADYSELAPYVYGKEYSTDVARRMMYGSCRTLKLLDESAEGMITSDSILSELDAKKIELQKERQKFFDQRREYSKLVNTDGRTEHLYQVLTDAAYKLSDTVGGLYNVESQHTPYDVSDNEAILVFSDWHYGLVADNVFNQYNTEICKKRVAAVTDAAINRIRLHKCKALHIVVLGDLWHGAIHTSARVASEELVVDQMMQVSEILAQTIEELSHYVNDTYVYVTYGNHARTVQSKNDNIHRDNMERLVPWWLSQRLQRNGSIHIQNDSGSEFLFITACGHDICASHGDLDSVRTSPRLLHTLFQKQYGKDIEYIILGDKHHSESFEELGIHAEICGSLCGTDDYANGKRLFSTPSQMLLIVSHECGVDAEYRIRL